MNRKIHVQVRGGPMEKSTLSTWKLTSGLPNIVLWRSGHRGRDPSPDDRRRAGRPPASA